MPRADLKGVFPHGLAHHKGHSQIVELLQNHTALAPEVLLLNHHDDASQTRRQDAAAQAGGDRNESVPDST